jgi:Domain of unknown function (DUF1857)
MPLTSFRAAVRAPSSVLWQMMRDKVRRPDKYLPNVVHVEIVRELSASAVERVMRVRTGASERTIREVISWDDATQVVIFKLLEDPQYTGFVSNMVFDLGATAELDYALHWVARNPDAPPDPTDWHAMIRGAVLHAKQLAEARLGE